jgi:predicted NBD/HSP70 family sugar kinase
MASVSSRAAHRHPTTSGSPRSNNLALALRCVADNSGEVSRADISASTGLNRSTASSLIDELIGGGLVRELGATVRSGVGRPPTALALRGDGPAGLGLDVNVDYITACVVDLTGKVRYQHVLAQDQRGHPSRQILDRIARLIQGALDAVTGSGLTLHGTAVAIPGLVNHTDGTLALSPNLGWHDLNVADVLQQQTVGGRVVLDNESNFAALSEDELLRADQSYLYINAQIGIGAGLVIEGELYRGRHGWSGEVGHITVDRDGPVCGCGRRGCLEQYAGHEAILRAAGMSSTPGTTFGVRPTAILIRERAGNGDPQTLDALAWAGRNLGTALAGCLNLLDVDRIVLGGIYRELAPWIVPEVEREIADHFVGARWSPPVVGTATHGAEAPALGAARSVVRGLVNDPLAWISR